MGFDLDAKSGIDHSLAAIAVAGRIRTPARSRVAFHHRGVVAVGRQHVLRGARLGVLDHLEQRQRLRLAVDGPAGIEDLVPAMFGIGLREHHQFDVVRIATEFTVARTQVVDLILGQRQPEARVGGFKPCQRNDFDIACRLRGEQRHAVFARRKQRLRHRIMQQLGQRDLRLRILRPADQVDTHATLDPAHRQAGAAQQLGGLAGPRRKRAQPWHDMARHRAGTGRSEAGRGLQNPAQGHNIRRAAGLGFNPVPMPTADDLQFGDEGLQAGLQAVAAERRQGRRALEDDHVRLSGWERCNSVAERRKPVSLRWSRRASPAGVATAARAADSC